MPEQHRLFNEAASERIAQAVRKNALFFRVETVGYGAHVIKNKIDGLEDAIHAASEWLGNEDWNADVMITALEAADRGREKVLGQTIVSFAFKPQDRK
jgi:hypothetical protein